MGFSSASKTRSSYAFKYKEPLVQQFFPQRRNGGEKKKDLTSHAKVCPIHFLQYHSTHYLLSSQNSAQKYHQQQLEVIHLLLVHLLLHHSIPQAAHVENEKMSDNNKQQDSIAFFEIRMSTNDKNRKGFKIKDQRLKRKILTTYNYKNF